MSLFTLTSDDLALTPHEFVANDAGQVLCIIHRLGWRAADIRQDGRYLYSLSLSEDGVWSLTNRPHLRPQLRIVM